MKKINNHVVTVGSSNFVPSVHFFKKNSKPRKKNYKYMCKLNLKLEKRG